MAAGKKNKRPIKPFSLIPVVPEGTIGIAQRMVMEDHPELTDLDESTEQKFREYLKDPKYNW